MDDQAESVDHLAGYADVEAHQIAGFVVLELVVETGIPATPGLEQIEEVEHDLGQREVVVESHPVGGQVLHVGEAPPLVVAQLHDRSHVLGRHHDGSRYVGLPHLAYRSGVWEVDRIADG